MNVKDRIKMFQPKGGAPAPMSSPEEPGRIPKPSRQTSKSKSNDSELFKAPAQFIATDEQTGKLRCNEKTLKLLSEINQPMNVIGITGLYRTGKSYLLNRLAGKKSGFKTGNEIHACTKGIWIWCRPHPYDEDQVLVLLDVEGFGDLEKVNRNEDTWLFTLATLLSSTLVYNNKGALDAYALDRLNFLEAIDSTIQVSQHEEDKRLVDFDFFFPYFVVTLRDFNLKMVTKSGVSITPDEYLEKALVQLRGEGDYIERYNKIRLLIRRYFKRRNCFVFKLPCGPNDEVEKLSDKNIEPDFLKSVEEFSEYIFSREPLQLKSCRKINGRMFANLALHYVTAMGQQKQPSILEATRYMIEVENQTSVTAASSIYKKRMQDYIAKMGDVTPTDEKLVDHHEQCLEAALDYFKQVIIFDDEDVFQRKAMSACKSLLHQFKRICDENSRKACADALERLNRRIEKKLKSGAYSCESGYDEYINDINWIARRYTGLTGLGDKAGVILQAFIDGKENEEELIYQLVLKAQTGEGDKKAIKEALRQQTKREGLKTAIMRSPSFDQDLRLKVEKMEEKLNQDLEKQCKDDKRKIQDNYIENLDMKIKELERQKSEKGDHGAALKEIEDQLAYFQKVREFAMTLTESTEVAGAEPDSKDKEEIAVDVSGLGERPVTMGESQENIYNENPVGAHRRKKAWCRMQ